jgi:TolB-like protein/DNA-binding winged helix-turn-helix (wHTH) protein/Tfp pilus assembly protein PilF
MTDPLRFGPFELDLENGQLKRDGVAIPLRQQALTVLAALASQPGRLVRRAELRSLLWGSDTFVDFEQGLNDCVSEIRAALGDRADAPVYIRTEPRRGYAFIAPVEAAGRLGPGAGRPGRRRRRALSAAALVGLGTLAVLMWREASRSTTRAGQVRLAILPFDNLSGDPAQDYLAEGLSEDVGAELGERAPRQLAILGRATTRGYRARPGELRELWAKDRVQYALLGSVRMAQGRIRVTASLVNASDGTQSWSASYEEASDDVIAVQGRIAAQIVEALPGAGIGPLRTSGARDPEAYDAYLRGLYLQGRGTAEGLLQAIEVLGQATERDPSFARAFAAQAQTYNRLAIARAIDHRIGLSEAAQAAREALRLDPELPTAHAALGAALHLSWDLEAADAPFRRALELGPGVASIQFWASGYLASLGRHAEAIAAARRALELDPASYSVAADLGGLYLMAGRYPESVAASQRALDLESDFEPARWFLLRAHESQANWDEARRVALELLERRRPPPGLALDRMSATQTVSLARRLSLEVLEAAARTGAPSWFELAALNAELGRTDAAFGWLEWAYARHEPFLVFLAVAPEFQDLRADPRFGALVGRIRARHADSAGGARDPRFP